MKLGEISENDTYQELLNKRGDFSDFFLQHIQDGSEEVENLDYVIIHLEGNLQSEELKEQKFVSVVTKNPLAIYTSAAVAQRKMITRSNSLRLASTNVISGTELKLSVCSVINRLMLLREPRKQRKTKGKVHLNINIHPILVKQKCLETVDKENIKDSKSYSSELLDGVNDIDEDDSENLLLASEYVNDIYDYLFQLEFEQPIVKNHLEGHVGVNVNMRPVLIDEINEVHLQFRLIPETFQMVVAIIERCLQAVTGTKRSQLQLVGVTGLFVAVKYEELFPPPIANFVYITHESYTDSQIRKMELKMIET
ncbi:G2/mitotic-specific cyclin-B-like [Glossina fuscipes]|uniref:G2/mitotic-specific cyclin-B-like n=1 Tax=Glossina fuscipes TaxID=7396 RepID=A0A9C6E227_9MUSC|nr:G2/mitotic-specific cyclin-B-like [Glossina fuscipes]